MASPTDSIMQQVDALLGSVRDLEQTSQYDDISDHPTSKLMHARSRLAAALERFAPQGSEYREALSRVNEEYGSAHNFAVLELAGVLSALRDDYADGYLRTVEQLVHADLFADFLEMAKELLDKGFKDPAAVLAGSVLEEHLRKLAQERGLGTMNAQGEPLSASRLNDDLKAHGTYDALEHKQVTAWQALRNDAAHGDYGNYDHKQVAALIQGVRDFMVRHPA